MTMKRLTKRAEDLLKEILDHRDDKGNCDSNYWKERFNSLSSADDAIVRSLFKELKEKDMIATHWADNYPYLILVLGNGLSYFEERDIFDGNNMANQNTNIFYGDASGVQIQQGTVNSVQSQGTPSSLDDSKVKELVQQLEKYDSILNEEFGSENAEKIRESAKELKELGDDHSKDSKRKNLIAYIRDLSVNAGGGLIAAGIIQLITSILG